MSLPPSNADSLMFRPRKYTISKRISPYYYISHFVIARIIPKANITAPKTIKSCSSYAHHDFCSLPYHFFVSVAYLTIFVSYLCVGVVTFGSYVPICAIFDIFSVYFCKRHFTWLIIGLLSLRSFSRIFFFTYALLAG